MIDKENFLTSYNIEPEELKAADLNWEELAAIYDDYLSTLRNRCSIAGFCAIISMIERQASIPPTGTAP